MFFELSCFNSSSIISKNSHASESFGTAPFSAGFLIFDTKLKKRYNIIYYKTPHIMLTTHQFFILFLLVTASFIPVFSRIPAVFASPSCSLAPQTGRTIISFDGNPIVSNADGVQSTSAFLTPVLVAGKYDVTLASFDPHHPGETPSESEERWYLQMKNSDGGIVATTNAIGDLPDNQPYLYQTVNTNLLFSMPTYSIVATHAAIYGSNANSVIPACVAFDLKDGAPVVTTGSASATESEAMLYGNVNPNGASDTYTWFEVGTMQSLNKKTEEFRVTTTQTISKRITGLSRGTTYFYRAAGRNASGTAYGPTLTFTTSSYTTSGSESSVSSVSPSPSSSPILSATILTTLTPTSVGKTSAILNGRFVSPSAIFASTWFEWDTQASLFRYASAHRNFSRTVSANMSDMASELLPNTTYYVRAVVETEQGTYYGNVITFRTRASSPISPLPPPPPKAPVISEIPMRSQRNVIDLTITPSDKILLAGKPIPFVITFASFSAKPLTNATLTITLPHDIAYQGVSQFSGVIADKGMFDSDLRTITFHLDTLYLGDKGSVTIAGLLKPNTTERKMVTTKAEISYTDASQNTAKETSFAINMVEQEENGFAAAFAGIGSWSLFIGIFLILFIVLLIIYLRLRRKEQEEQRNKPIAR